MIATESTEMTTTMRATVLCAEPGALLVCDHATGQRVRVLTERACCFFAGELVCIHFNGAMTMSIPPQISAGCVCRICRR